MINFPLLKTFEVESSVTDFLNEKLEQYRNLYDDEYINNNADRNAFTNEEKNSGYQTLNLLEWDDQELNNFRENKLLDIISFQIGIDKSKVSYHWMHMLEYENGGSMDYHNHMHNEDYVLFIYLETCNSGETVFHLNHSNPEYSDRTKIKVKPKKNLAAVFSALVMHKGEYTEENKKIFVVGVRINTND